MFFNISFMVFPVTIYVHCLLRLFDQLTIPSFKPTHFDIYFFKIALFNCLTTIQLTLYFLQQAEI